jgi:hypothetical protein
MSIEALTWALTTPLGGNPKVILMGLANHAHPDGTETYPTLETLSVYACCDRSTVRRNLRRLVADGWAVEDGLGPKGQTKYRLPVGRTVAESGGGDLQPPEPSGGGTLQPEGGSNATGGGGTAMPPEPSFNRPTTKDHHQGDAEGIDAEMLRDVEGLLKAKTKVAGRVVTEAEMRVAAAALSEYNRQAGSDFGLGANLTGIVGRIRERPSWDAAKHRRLVRSAWRIRWWEKRNGGARRPTPQVIYGNARVFEQVAQDAADELAGRPVDLSSLNGNGGRLKSATFSGGRAWDELTPNEQAVAKENASMGIFPEDREAASSPAQTEAWNGGEALTAENF